MKAVIGVGLVLIQQAGPLPVSPDARMLFASRLFMATLEARVKAGQDVAGLSIEAMGPRRKILVIEDDTDEAKGFYDHLMANEDTRLGLLKLGFKVAMLVNAKHGTFIFTLEDNVFDKPDIRIS